MTDEQRVFARGVKGRGSEVIKMLEDLGGKVPPLDLGGNPRHIYFISHDGDITCALYDSEAGKIIMDNYREIKLPEWKDGDILIKNDGTCYKIFSEYVFHNITSFYAYNIPISVNGTITDYKVGVWVCDIKDYRLATPSEVEHFYKLLHASNKDWNAEKKQLVDWKWKPKDGEDYYYIISNGIVHLSTWFDYKVDNSRFSIGNCFKTKEEAETMAEKFKKLLKGKS